MHDALSSNVTSKAKNSDDLQILTALHEGIHSRASLKIWLALSSGFDLQADRPAACEPAVDIDMQRASRI